MRSAEIKDVDSRDSDAWLPLWEGYQRFYEVDIPESVTLETWSCFLDPAEPIRAVLAMVGDRAWVWAHSICHRSTWTIGDYCYLQDLFVADEARGLGVGRALIKHVYADARGRGALRAYGSTHEADHDAMELYHRVADRSDFMIYRKALG